jgi:hypothetical protein
LKVNPFLTSNPCPAPTTKDGDGLTDLLDEWLSKPAKQKMVHDPVFWWYEKQKSDKRIEPLAQMGIDVLSIPGKSQHTMHVLCTHLRVLIPAASCQMERYFSKSGLMVTPKRESLKTKTVRSSQLVAAWEDAGLLPKAELITMFEQKKFRPNNGGKVKSLSM